MTRLDTRLDTRLGIMKREVITPPINTALRMDKLDITLIIIACITFLAFATVAGYVLGRVDGYKFYEATHPNSDWNCQDYPDSGFGAVTVCWKEL